jgi:hypothetical protein
MDRYTFNKFKEQYLKNYKVIKKCNFKDISIKLNLEMAMLLLYLIIQIKNQFHLLLINE